MNINKKKSVILAFILFLVVSAFFINERRKSAAEKLTIPPIDKYFTEHNYQAPPSFVADASLFFNEDSISTLIGKDFNLIAKVNPGSNSEKGVNAVQLDVNFDSAILEFYNVSAVEPFMQMGAPVVDNNKGTLSVAFFIGGSQIKSIAEVANLTFKTKAITTDSVISFASSAQVAVNDGSGSMVLGNSGKASVKVSE